MNSVIDPPLFLMTGELLLDCLFMPVVWSSSQDDVEDPDSSSVESDGG